MRSWESDQHECCKRCGRSCHRPCPPSSPCPCPCSCPCPNCPTGPIGPTGPKGNTGNTGNTGATATNDNLFAISANKNVAKNAALPFDSSPVSSGSNIIFNLATPTLITIKTPGIYLIKFRADVFASTGTGYIGVQLKSDASIVDETTIDNIGGNTANNSQLVYLHGLVNTAGDEKTITVINTSSINPGQGDNITFRTAKLIVVKLV